MASKKQTATVPIQHVPSVTTGQVAAFDRLKSQLSALYAEISALSKKSADGAVNKFKLGILNEKLAEINELLGEDFKPSKQFTVFDVDSLPSNSDVVMMLSQYHDALETWRSGHIHKIQGMYDIYDWYWNTDDGTSIDATPPTRYTDR